MKSTQWYNHMSNQSMVHNVVRLPAIVRSGATSDGTERKTKGLAEKKHFVVGETEVGGGEVVGG